MPGALARQLADHTMGLFAGFSWETKPVKYLGTPLKNYRDSDPFSRAQAQEIRDSEEEWKRINLSMFDRATVDNLFLVLKFWFVMQVIHCSRTNVQKSHRIFAVLYGRRRRRVVRELTSLDGYETVDWDWRTCSCAN